LKRGLPILVLALGAASPVPWPGGAAPDELAVSRARDLATGRWEQDRFLEFKSSVENETEAAVKDVLQEQIDRGDFDLPTMQLYGRRLFQLPWRSNLGLGTGAGARTFLPVHRGDTPGLDTQACEGCHSQGGLDGAGTFTQSPLLFGDGDAEASAIRRNPPALMGLGLVQALGVEMSAELAAQREAASRQAKASGQPVKVALQAKGVAFGALTARPDGTVDTGELRGVDADLVVRPFGWKGDVARLRRFVEDAARQHFGVISHVEALAQRGRGPDPRLGGGADWEDPDGDGVRRELEEGIITTGAVYLELLETPVILPPADATLQARWAHGSQLFDQLGCASCHVRSMQMTTRVWRELPDTTGGPGYEVALLSVGDQPRGTDLVALFSDLRRHDMGPGLAEAKASPYGVAPSEFLTRPLWGLAESAPYLHDGRAPTIPDAVLAHDGEARQSREAYAAAKVEDQQDLLLFLLSLTRAPGLHVAR